MASPLTTRLRQMSSPSIAVHTVPKYLRLGAEDVLPEVMSEETTITTLRRVCFSRRTQPSVIAEDTCYTPKYT